MIALYFHDPAVVCTSEALPLLPHHDKRPPPDRPGPGRPNSGSGTLRGLQLRVRPTHAPGLQVLPPWQLGGKEGSHRKWQSYVELDIGRGEFWKSHPRESTCLHVPTELLEVTRVGGTSQRQPGRAVLPLALLQPSAELRDRIGFSPNKGHPHFPLHLKRDPA